MHGVSGFCVCNPVISRCCFHLAPHFLSCNCCKSGVKIVSSSRSVEVETSSRQHYHKTSFAYSIETSPVQFCQDGELKMFGNCDYLPVSPRNSSRSVNQQNATDDLPLDLSCKSRENSSKPFHFDTVLRHHQNEESNSHDSSHCSQKTLSKKEWKSDHLANESEIKSLKYETDQSEDSSSQIEDDHPHILMSNSRIQTPTVTSHQHQQATVPKRNRERTFLPCQVCGKAFDRPSLLKRHIRTHTGEKPHVCDVCGKGFSTSSSLNTHRRIHSGEKPHQCPICGKRFTASSNLYYHRMTHVKEKPHKCTMCHKSFPTPGDLKSHMYVHNGSWPFQCHVCKRGFSKQTNLRNHLFLHTGKKPHNCPQCGKCFALACNLRAHMRTHSEAGSFHSALNGDHLESVSASEDGSHPVKAEPAPSVTQTVEDGHCIVPPLPTRLVDHVFFWQTIQQQLATNILVQQQQAQINPLHLMSNPLNRPFKFPNK